MAGACKSCLGCLLKFFNFLLTLLGLSMIGYGIYLFIQWKKITDQDDQGGGGDISPSGDFVQLGRPMLLLVSLSDNILDKLPKAWFIYLFIGIGAALVIISFFGCIGSCTTNGCCLSCYSFLLVLLILAELGAAAFIFFDESWKDVIPKDKTGNFDMMYDFLDDNWKIVKWVALGAIIFEAVVFLLALLVRAANRPESEYDSDDEYIAPRSQVRQPLLNNRQAAPPATGVPVGGAALDQRIPSRNDAWSARMREKYGLDTSEFTYNPSESNRYPQPTAQPTEEKGRCTIM